MEVVFLSLGDWANIGSHLAESLRRVGVKAKSWASWHLKMDYPIKSNVYTDWEEVKEDTEKAKVVWLMHGNVFKHRTPYWRRDQIICAWHGGPPLLQMSEERSTISQDFFGRYLRRDLHPIHFIQHPRLYDNCYFLERKYLLSPPVDTERLQPTYYNRSKLVIGHFPRNTGTGLITKGHDKVVNVLSYVNGNFSTCIDTKFIDWDSHIRRIDKCDIYVEKLSVVLREWGMTALEAAALGKIVIGQFDNRETYEKYYGQSPMLTANTETELKEVLYNISTWGRGRILHHQKLTRAWAEKYHSFEAVGRRLKNILIKEGATIG